MIMELFVRGKGNRHKELMKWHHDTQNNDMQLNDTHPSDKICDAAEGRNAKCRCQVRNAECRYASLTSLR